MKVLIDHCVDWRLKRFLPGHAVQTAKEMGWGTLRNSLLLDQAQAAGFEALLTVDRGFGHQQNLTGRSIAVILFRVPNNRLPTMKALAPARKARVLPYIVSQLAGAIVAAACLFVLFEPFLAEKEKQKRVTRGGPGSEATAVSFPVFDAASPRAKVFAIAPVERIPQLMRSAVLMYIMMSSATKITTASCGVGILPARSNVMTRAGSPRHDG